MSRVNLFSLMLLSRLVAVLPCLAHQVYSPHTGCGQSFLLSVIHLFAPENCCLAASAVSSFRQVAISTSGTGADRLACFVLVTLFFIFSLSQPLDRVPVTSRATVSHWISCYQILSRSSGSAAASATPFLCQLMSQMQCSWGRGSSSYSRI